MQDKDEVQHQISILLFLGLACGVLMFFFTRFLGARALTGTKNLPNNYGSVESQTLLVIFDDIFIFCMSH